MRSVSDGQMEWPIPVVTKGRHPERATLTVAVVDGQVVAILDGKPFVIPPDSDKEWCDALHRARRVQLRLGHGFS